MCRPTSQHFRNAISRNCNASCLFLHFCGVPQGGFCSRRLSLFVLRFSKTHYVLGNSGGNPAYLSALSQCDFKKLQCLPATFAFLGGNPGVTPGVPFETSLTFRVIAFSDFQKHITFSYFSEVTPPPSQHFRVAILRICNTSRLLLHFWEVTPG